MTRSSDYRSSGTFPFLVNSQVKNPARLGLVRIVELSDIDISSFGQAEPSLEMFQTSRQEAQLEAPPSLLRNLNCKIEP